MPKTPPVAASSEAPSLQEELRRLEDIGRELEGRELDLDRAIFELRHGKCAKDYVAILGIASLILKMLALIVDPVLEPITGINNLGDDGG